MTSLQTQNEHSICSESLKPTSRNGWHTFGRGVVVVGCIYIFLSILLPLFQPFPPHSTQPPQVTVHGLSLEGYRNDTTYFGIPPGKEDAAARDLLTAIASGFEVCLRNDLDEGREGCTFFRRSTSGLETMTGGHHWQSKWKPTDQRAVVTAVAELAHLNRGGHWSAQGSFEPSR